MPSMSSMLWTDTSQMWLVVCSNINTLGFWKLFKRFTNPLDISHAFVIL